MRLLRFISQYLWFLKRIPLLPQAFDGVLLLYSYVVHPQILDLIDEVGDEIASWPETHITFHRFGGTEFKRGQTEIGHVHSNGICDVLLSRASREDVVNAGLALPHHTVPDSSWVSMILTNTADKEVSIKILRRAYDEHKKRGKN